MSEAKGDWPAGWELVTIGDVVVPKVEQGSPTTDFTYIDIGSVNNKTKQINSAKDLIVGNKTPSRAQQHVWAGDILVSMTRPNLNAVAKVPTELDGAICSTGFDVLRPIEVEPDWLFLIVKSRPFVEAMASLVQGALYPAVRPADVRRYKFALPPLAEQRRIVAKIEALQERSRRTREALSEMEPLLEQFRQSVLAAAFRGHLTADWRASHPKVEPASELLHRIRAERRRCWEQAELIKYEAKGQKPPKNWQDKYEEPEPVADSELPELPEGWCWTKLGELALIDSGEAFKKKDYRTSGLRLLQIANVGFGKTLWHQRNYLPEHFAKSRGFLLLDKADITMALNRPILDGRLKVTRINDDDLPTILYQRVGRLRTAVSEIVDYLFAFMRSPLMLQQVERNLQGTDQPYINTSDIPNIIVPLAPLAEQTAILTFVSRSLDVEGTIEEQRSEVLNGLDQFDQSALTKAFRGELVPQDPNDEPASVLLERIRAQRKQQSEAPKQMSKSQQTSKLGRKSSRLEVQQLTLAEVLRTAD
jgi:type I restriction enzyme, S subunit